MKITNRDLKKILGQAIYLVKETGNIIKSRIGTDIKVKHKGEIDLVTEIDITVEEELKKGLKQILDAQFLAEESSHGNIIGVEPVWVIDPIDGTTNFAHALPMVATSVALLIQGKVVVGIINLPIINEIFYAIKGQGAYLNSQPIGISCVSLMNNSLIATGFPYDIRSEMKEVIGPIQNVLMAAQGLRRMGAAAIDLAYVACGRFDGFYEKGLKPWDVAAGWLLVEEAGGKVTQYSSNRPFDLYSPNILATNGKIHEELSRLICS